LETHFGYAIQASGKTAQNKDHGILYLIATELIGVVDELIGDGQPASTAVQL